MKTFSHKLILLLMAAAVVLGLAPSADAAFKIRISTNGGSSFLTLADGGGSSSGGGATLSADNDAATGAINAVYDDAVVHLNFVGGQSKPLFGNTPSLAAMDLGITGSFKVATGTVIIDITDTGFAPPLNPAGNGVLQVLLGGSTLTLPNASVTGYLNGDDNGSTPFIGNKEFAGTAQNPIDVGSSLITAGPATQANPLKTQAGTAFAPYSLTMRTTFDSGGVNAGISFDDRLTFASPAPGGLLLAAFGSPVLGLGYWVRRRRTATPV